MIRTAKNKKHLHSTLVIAILGVVIIGVSVLGWYVRTNTPATEVVSIVPGDYPDKTPATVPDTPTPTPTQTQDAFPPDQSATPVSEFPVTLSQELASSISVVVNKKYKLPATYAPSLATVRGSSVRQEIATPLENLLSAAESAGHTVKIISAYRSYSTQQSVYSGYVNQYGQATADTFSARPGHSEHQTGLAVDVGNANGSCDLEICFGQSALGTWIRENAHTYGFIVRYPEGKEVITGYQYEPWHLRYVGENTAWGIVETGQTMDQFFNIQAGDY